MNEKDEECQTIYREDERTVLLSVKRHINMGERSFQNAETTLYAQARPNLSDQLDNLRLIRNILNIWETEERENYLDMQKKIREQEKEHDERERYEQDQKDAKFRKELLEHIEANPGCGTDDLLLTFEVSQYILSNHMDQLVVQGKLQRKPCREAFTLAELEEIQDPDDIEDLNDPE